MDIQKTIDVKCASLAGLLLLALSQTGCSSPALMYTHADPASQAASADEVTKADAQAMTQTDTFVLPYSRLVIGPDTSKSNEVALGNNVQVPDVSTDPNVLKAKTDKKADAPADKNAGAVGQLQQNNGQQSTNVTSLGNGISVSVLPVESADYYRVSAVNEALSSTQMQITKISNTDIPSSVSINFISTAQRIAAVLPAVASAGAAVAAFTSSSGQCASPTPLTTFSITLDGSTLHPEKGTLPQLLKVDKQPCWKYKIELVNSSGAPNTISRKSFDDFVEKKSQAKLHFWPVPACRDIKLTVSKNSGDGKWSDIIGTVRIADPEYIRVVPLPQKGKITMHPICNADVTDSASDPYADWATTVQKTFDTAKALETAINPAPTTSSASTSKSTSTTTSSK